MSNPPVVRILALGRVRVYRDERELTSRDWTYSKARELLVYLASNPPRTKEQIGLALWPNASETQLRNNYRVTLFHLRRALGNPDWVQFSDEHYAFNHALSYTFDLETFEQKIAEATRLKAAMSARAAALIQEAAQLYQGNFCEDLAEGDWHMVRQLELQRKYLDALLMLGQLQFAERRFALAADTYRMVLARDSYREAAHRGLMRCLAQMGESAQAILHYRTLATNLRTELHQKPESETTALFERIQSGTETQTSAAAAPFQSPVRVSRFVGRESELEQMKHSLGRDPIAKAGESAPGDSPPARIFGLAGMGGIGKTTLAVELAHRLRAQFPDGVLWAHVATSEPMAILDSWARAYQCDYSALPDLESRAAAMRSLLADKQALLILDDVWSADRARPLLFGGPQCRMIVTSRSLEAITALDAELLQVPTLTSDEGELLLTRIVGNARVQAESESAAAIGELLGQLPLALEIAGKRLAMNPRWPLKDLAERLRDQFKRLDELKLGDRAVRASFAISWEMLPDHLRRLFAHLAVFEGRSFTASALSAVAQVERRVANDGLDALVALSLLSPLGTVHYHQHPLIADFALEKLDADAEPRARMARFYLDFASEHQSDYLALEEEWDNLSAGMRVAHHQKRWQNVIDFASALTPAWFARGRFSDARAAYPLACEAATAEEDQDAYIASTLKWGQACIEQGDYAEAKEHLERGLQVSREVDDQVGVALANFLNARVAVEQSNYEFARNLLGESQQIRKKLSDMPGVAETLYMQARICFLLRDYAESERLGRQALEIQTQVPVNHALIVTLRWLAVALARLGKHSEAEQFGQQALTMSEQLADVGEQAVSLYHLSLISRSRSDFSTARRYSELSLPLVRKMGDRKVEAHTLHQMSLISTDLGEFDFALQDGVKSLQIYRALDDKLGMASALRYNGDILKELGQLKRACLAWSEALDLATQLDHPWRLLLQDRIRQYCVK